MQSQSNSSLQSHVGHGNVNKYGFRAANFVKPYYLFFLLQTELERQDVHSTETISLCFLSV